MNFFLVLNSRISKFAKCLSPIKGFGTYKMTSLRIILIRFSVFLNALLISYLFLSWHSTSPLEKVPSYRGLSVGDFDGQGPKDSIKRHPLGQYMSVVDDAKVNNAQNSEYSHMNVNDLKGRKSEQNLDVESEAKPLLEDKVVVQPLAEPDKIDERDSPLLEKAAAEAGEKAVEQGEEAGSRKDLKEPEEKGSLEERENEYQEPPREVQERAGATEGPVVVAPLAEDGPDPPLDSLERKMYPNLRDCNSKILTPRYIQKGEYWVLENYIPAAMNFRCDESITYTTHSDYTFLDNLDPLTSRWQGPVSVAVYCPGTDFQATIDTILYLRSCMAEGVKKYVTFHLFFPASHIPKTQIPTTDELLQKKTACDKDPPKWTNVTTYRQQKKLLYPINVARNVARGNSATYFNLPSDVELYPSINVIPEFFKMLKKPDASNSTNQRVFVFPIFEVAENQNVPETKAELQSMLKSKKAIPFHKYVCPKCHAQPKSKEWQDAVPKQGFSVFYVGKRQPPYTKWEPIYIGTEREPIYDERLSWEGKSDKMTQMYILCVRDYEFHILDNAFLVHKPGIKKYHKEAYRDKISSKQSFLIRKKIFPEYKMIFGVRKNCII